MISVYAARTETLPQVASERRIKYPIGDEDVVNRKHGANVARWLRVVN